MPPLLQRRIRARPVAYDRPITPVFGLKNVRGEFGVPFAPAFPDEAGRGGVLDKGGGFMQSSAVVSRSVHEPELDMKRSSGRPHAGLVRRLMFSIVGYARPDYTIDAPKRSIDREEQEYSPSYY